FGFCFALLVLGQSLQAYRGMIAGSSLLILMGVVDDFKELRPRLRLIGQVLAAIFLTAWGGKLVSNLGDIFFMGDVQLAMWAFPVTVICIVGFINSMNMLDGQDGLAGGVALTQSFLLFLLATQEHLHGDMRMLVIISVILMVFLSFNMRTPLRRKASIFMGDSGITFVAFLISWFAIELSQADAALIRPMSILWILAFPLFDLVAVSLHRLSNGKPVFQASRDHFHHLLHVAGLSVELSTFLLCMLSFGLGGIGLIMNAYHVVEGWQFLSFIGALILYLVLVKCVRDPVMKAVLENEPA
ncbi:MAG: undecaprenyl/decaprenyl-phosphate alpha-N-acetylglucosaminyl 1-phosphate transferase, partial [Coxiellaceae bacterium]|nr:undecaprenyl/decaprenyl-phosphate alpha-N-acetylglucosaminyl 1-phosphate transferase [Coxiellaceae bacterium]